MREVYRGFWVYGGKKTVWSSEKDYAKQVARDTPLASGHFEDLRIVSDKVWRKAQELLQEEKANSGRKPKDGDRLSRPRLLRGLYVCPEHDRQLVVGGPQGRVLFCPLCRAVKKEKRPIFTHLNRALALELTSQKLRELIQADDTLVSEIVAACQQASEEAQKPNPEVLNSLRAKLRKLIGTIEFNRRNPGDSEEEQQRTEQLLKELNHEKNSLLADIAIQEEAAKGVIVVPTPEDVKTLLGELDQLMIDASTLENEEQMRPARRIIDELTGGRIELFQMGQREARKGWLQGRFYVDINQLILARVAGISVPTNPSSRMEVTIDYRKSKVIDAQADEAKRLWDQGLLHKQIAKEMQLLPSYITKLINHWFDSHGLPRPDGRRRRALVTDKQTSTPLYKRIADEVMQCVNDGLSNLTIAKQFNTSDTTVAKAIAWWFESRGLPALSAADRRRISLQRAKSMFECGTPIKDIAKELGYSPRGLKLALASYFEELGGTMPDGRARRGNSPSDDTSTES
jgi:AraC-like DNA-binding protein